MRRLFIVTVMVLVVFILLADVSSGQQLLKRRNPFAPLNKTASSFTKRGEDISPTKKAGLHLNGILWNKDNPMAIINDTVVRVGSEIAGRKVAAVLKGYVELEYYGKKETLRITPKILFNITSKTLDKKAILGTRQ